MSIKDLPLEIIEQALLDYDYDKLVQICSQTEGERLHTICNSPKFWLAKLMRDPEKKNTYPYPFYIESIARGYKIYEGLLVKFYNFDESYDKYEALKSAFIHNREGSLNSFLYDEDIFGFVTILFHKFVKILRIF